MIGIDLFSGAGGMSVGAISAGIDVRVAVEADPHAAITYRENHTSTCLLDQRIEAVQDVPLGRRDRKIILFGGPPCQGFSTSNQRTRNSDNPSNWLFREYMRLVRMIQPEWVVFENVNEFLRDIEISVAKPRQRLTQIEKTLSGCGLEHAERADGMKLAALSLPAPQLIVKHDLVGSGLLRYKNGVTLAGTDTNAQKL